MSRKDTELDLRQEMVELLKQPGWLRYHAMLQAQLSVRRVMSMKQCSSSEAAFANEFVKGEYAGLLLAAQWVDLAIKSSEEAAALLEKKEKQDVPTE